MLRPARQPLSSRLADNFLLATIKTVRALLLPWPMSVRIRFGGWGGWVAGRLSRRRHLALNNLKRAFGPDHPGGRAEFKKIVDASYRDLGRSFVEFLMSDSIDAEYFTSHVTVEGEEKIARLSEEGRGVVLLTGHFGNWEFLNLMAGVRGIPLAVLAKVQKMPATDKYLNRMRAHRGARVVVRGIDMRQIYRTLAERGLVGILADQDGGPNGVYAPLFGRQASYPRGVARFSRKAGAPALPVFVVRTSLDRHWIHVGTPIRPQAGESEKDFERRTVEEFSRQLEAAARLYPTQWLWAHRRFKSSPERDIVVLDDGRKGHANQSLAMATQVAESRAGVTVPGARDLTRVRTIPVVYRSSTARAALTAYGILTGGRLWGGMGLLRWALEPKSYAMLSTVPADTVISCGTSTEAVNLILSRDCQAKSCYIQKPQFGAKHFSTVLAPGHDRVKRSANTLRTPGALSFVHPDRLRELRDRARIEAGMGRDSRAAALLVGGPSKHTAWEPALLEELFFALREFSREHKLYLLVTTSRRTDAAVESAVERLFTGEPFCPVIVIPARANPAKAYEGILAAADAVLVTTDSVSMVSEAVATGKPVGLIEPGPAKDRRGKLSRFLTLLEAEGSAKRVSRENLREFLSRNALGSHRPATAAGSNDAVRRAVEILSS